MGLTDLIPVQYRLAAKVAGVVFLVVGLLSFGFYKGYEYKADKDAAQEMKDLKAEFAKGQASTKATVQIVTKYLVNTATITQEEVKYVSQVKTAIPDADNVHVNAGAVRLLDASVQDSNAAASGSPDGTAASSADSGAVPEAPAATGDTSASGVGTDLRTVTGTEIYNDELCKANAEQLQSLEDWINAQLKIYGTAPTK